jgi:hypothetical protein
MRGRQPCISAGRNAFVQAMADIYTLYNIQISLLHPYSGEMKIFILNKYAVILSVLKHLF